MYLKNETAKIIASVILEASLWTAERTQWKTEPLC
jgi:hypothetical protein